jgi:hypothetical protein
MMQMCEKLQLERKEFRHEIDNARQELYNQQNLVQTWKTKCETEKVVDFRRFFIT